MDYLGNHPNYKPKHSAEYDHRDMAKLRSAHAVAKRNGRPHIIFKGSRISLTTAKAILDGYQSRREAASGKHWGNPKGTNNVIAKTVYKYEASTGDFICKYEDAKEAAKDIDRKPAGIYACCIGNATTCGGYKWSYEKKDNINLKSKGK
jgi:hypothetical protein